MLKLAPGIRSERIHLVVPMVAHCACDSVRLLHMRKTVQYISKSNTIQPQTMSLLSRYGTGEMT